MSAKTIGFNVEFQWSDGSATSHYYESTSFEGALEKARNDRESRMQPTNRLAELVRIVLVDVQAYDKHKRRLS